jgi:hypothetical protein
MNRALWLALVVVTAMAWALASKRREHRPIAVLLSLGLAAEVAQRALSVAVLAPLRAALGVDVPWSGWARAAGLLYDAVALTWPAALVGAALVVFAGRRPWAALLGWSFAVAAFAGAHPIAGDGSQARAYTAVQTLAVAIAAGLGLGWIRGRATPATTAQYALAMMVIAELVSLLGAWRVGLFEGWPIAQALYLVMFGVVALVQGRFLWTSPQSALPSA